MINGVESRSYRRGETRCALVVPRPWPGTSLWPIILRPAHSAKTIRWKNISDMIKR